MSQHPKIRIRTKSGQIIERAAIITDWLKSDGTQFATAQSGRVYYYVADRDADGPIWAVNPASHQVI